MRERAVRNLVIDRADRLTREGMLAAASLLSQFTAMGVTLHVVSMAMTIKDELQVMLFLQMAFAAQQANKARIAAMMRAKRKNAENGRFLRGNHPPYGFLYEPVEVNEAGRPTKIALAPDMREIGGHRAWETRRNILHWYLEGASIRRIAKRLTEEGAPPARLLAGQHGSRHWEPSVIADMLRDPLNIGVARSFRYKTEIAPPDRAHDYAWMRRVDTPMAEQIELPGVVTPPFLLTADEAAQMERRLETAQRFRPATTATQTALLRGGLARARCAAERCGYAMTTASRARTTPTLVSPMNANQRAAPASLYRANCLIPLRGRRCWNGCFSQGGSKSLPKRKPRLTRARTRPAGCISWKRPATG
jgi:DNA invertase Pin-like site-specific DNA recombinase